MPFLSTPEKGLSAVNFKSALILYAFSLSVISITFIYFLLDLRNRDLLTVDIVSQRHVLVSLQTRLSKNNDDINKLLFANLENQSKLESQILASSEDYQYALVVFSQIATKYDFITDLSLASEAEQALHNLRKQSFDIIKLNSMGNKKEATEIFNTEFSRNARLMNQFISEAMYAKDQLTSTLLKKNETFSLAFIILFLAEVLFTFFLGFKYILRFKIKLVEAGAQLEKLASYDDLTGIYNRRMFLNYLEHSIAKSDRDTHCNSVFYFDIDGFKNINDTFGHTVGDQLLQGITERVKGQLRESDIFARIGGDEFVILIEKIEGPEFVDNVANKILTLFKTEFHTPSTRISISTSIGIKLFNDSLLSAEEILKDADSAMYDAKNSGKDCFRFYERQLNLALNIKHK